MEDHTYERKIQAMNDKSLAATKNMVVMMEEGRDAGYKTQANLDRQGERLRGIENDMDNMGCNLSQAEDDLDQMNGNGCLGCKKKRKKKWEKGDSKKKGKTKYKRVGSCEEEAARARNGSKNFHFVTGDHKEKQMAENLDYVDNILDEMDYLADDLNREIMDQGKRIDRIDQKGKKNKEQLERANAKADRIAGKKSKTKESPESQAQEIAIGQMLDV